MSSTASGATACEITLAGHLGDQWRGRLGDLDISRNDDGTTTLTGRVADQAQLHGVLAGLRDIGVELLELHATPAVRGTVGAATPALDRRPAGTAPPGNPRDHRATLR